MRSEVMISHVRTIRTPMAGGLRNAGSSRRIAVGSLTPSHAQVLTSHASRIDSYQPISRPKVFPWAGARVCIRACACGGREMSTDKGGKQHAYGTSLHASTPTAMLTGCLSNDYGTEVHSTRMRIITYQKSPPDSSASSPSQRVLPRQEDSFGALETPFALVAAIHRKSIRQPLIIRAADPTP